MGPGQTGWLVIQVGFSSRAIVVGCLLSMPARLELVGPSSVELGHARKTELRGSEILLKQRLSTRVQVVANQPMVGRSQSQGSQHEGTASDHQGGQALQEATREHAVQHGPAQVPQEVTRSSCA